MLTDTPRYEVVYRREFMTESELYSERQEIQIGQNFWILFCEKDSQQRELSSILTAAHAIQAVNVLWWAYYFITSLPIKSKLRLEIRDTKFWRIWKAARPYMRVVNGLACLAFMWLLLAKFVEYRETVTQLAAGADQDSTWTFGQVLALATWAPTAVDFLSVYFCKSYYSNSRTPVKLTRFLGSRSRRRSSRTSLGSVHHHRGAK